MKKSPQKTQDAKSAVKAISSNTKADISPEELAHLPMQIVEMARQEIEQMQSREETDDKGKYLHFLNLFHGIDARISDVLRALATGVPVGRMEGTVFADDFRKGLAAVQASMAVVGAVMKTQDELDTDAEFNSVVSSLEVLKALADASHDKTKEAIVQKSAASLLSSFVKLDEKRWGMLQDNNKLTVIEAKRRELTAKLALADRESLESVIHKEHDQTRGSVQQLANGPINDIDKRTFTLLSKKEQTAEKQRKAARQQRGYGLTVPRDPKRKNLYKAIDEQLATQKKRGERRNVSKAVRWVAKTHEITAKGKIDSLRVGYQASRKK